MQHRPLLRLAALSAVFVLGVATTSEAAVVWPGTSGWHTIDQGGSQITDTNGPNGQGNRLDIRGTATYSAGFVLYDDAPANDNLMFRMRMDADPAGNLNRIWQVLIDSDADTGVDWVLQVDGRTDNQVELVATTTEGTTYSAVRMSTTPTWSGALATYMQTSAVDDGSNFSGNTDYFLDIAIPWSQFTSATGLGTTSQFNVALTTSQRHNRINMDYPFNFGGGTSVSSGWSDSFSANDVRVPEPGTWALFGLGALILAARVRRRRHPPAPPSRISPPDRVLP